MNGWELVCLAIMAFALVAMAMAQTVIALAASRAAREATEAIREFRRELRPIVEKVNTVAENASKVTALAVAQMERVDQAIASTADRIEEAVETVQTAIATPVRQSAAIIAGLRAAFSVFRGSFAGGKSHGRDDEDALFIG